MPKGSVWARTRAIQRVHRLYKKDNAGLGGCCVYCGAAADSMDHVPPVSIASDMELEALQKLGPKLFPSCRNCNSILGDALPLLLVDRRDLIASYLSAKKRRMLARGREIFERKLPVFGDFREMACLQVYQRWLFASVTQNEASPVVEKETEEAYVRHDFTKHRDVEPISSTLWLASWGLPEDLRASEEVAQSGTGTPFDDLTDAEWERLLVAAKFPEVRGPIGWPGSLEDYRTSLTDTLSEIRIAELEEAFKKLGEHGARFLMFLSGKIIPFASEGEGEGARTIETAAVQPPVEAHPSSGKAAAVRKKKISPKTQFSARTPRIPGMTPLSDLVSFDPVTASVRDINRPVSGFPNVTTGEIRFAIECLDEMSLADARNKVLDRIRRWLRAGMYGQLRADDGRSVFAAIALSPSCSVTDQQSILTRLADHLAR